MDLFVFASEEKRREERKWVIGVRYLNERDIEDNRELRIELNLNFL